MQAALVLNIRRDGPQNAVAHRPDARCNICNITTKNRARAGSSPEGQIEVRHSNSPAAASCAATQTEGKWILTFVNL